MMGWNFLWEAFLRSTLLLVGAQALLRLSKRQSAAFRHRLLLGVFGLLAVLPILCAILPSIDIPFSKTAAIQSASVTVREVSSKAVRVPGPYKIPWLTALWFSGFIVTLAPALIGSLSVFRMLQLCTGISERRT